MDTTKIASDIDGLADGVLGNVKKWKILETAWIYWF